MKCTSLKRNQGKKEGILTSSFCSSRACAYPQAGMIEATESIFTHFNAGVPRNFGALWAKKSLKTIPYHTIVEWYPVSYQRPEFITTAKGSYVSVQTSIGPLYKKDLSAVVLYVFYSLLL